MKLLASNDCLTGQTWQAVLQAADKSLASAGPAQGAPEGEKNDFLLEKRPENAVTAVTHTNLALRYRGYHHLRPLLTGGKGGNLTGYSSGPAARGQLLGAKGGGSEAHEP